MEAAFVIPFLSLIIFAFLCLCMYLHDRSLLASCAAELAGKGAVKKYQTEKELEEWLKGQAEGLVSGRLLTLREFEVSVDVTWRSITVECRGESQLLGGIEIHEEGKAERLNPVKYIREVRRFTGRGRE